MAVSTPADRPGSSRRARLERHQLRASGEHRPDRHGKGQDRSDYEGRGGDRGPEEREQPAPARSRPEHSEPTDPTGRSTCWASARSAVRPVESAEAGGRAHRGPRPAASSRTPPQSSRSVRAGRAGPCRRGEGCPGGGRPWRPTTASGRSQRGWRPHEGVATGDEIGPHLELERRGPSASVGGETDIAGVGGPAPILHRSRAPVLVQVGPSGRPRSGPVSAHRGRPRRPEVVCHPVTSRIGRVT
jgi:hypothetical protein